MARVPTASDAMTASHVDELHVAAVKIDNAIEDRDLAIRQAYLDGLSAAAIGEAVGLTRQRIHQIIGNVPSRRVR